MKEPCMELMKRRTACAMRFMLLLTVGWVLIQLTRLTCQSKCSHRLKDAPSELQKVASQSFNDAHLAAIAKKFGSVCHNRDCLAALEAALHNKAERVPRIRHILWKSENVSAYFASQLKTWSDIQPNWTYVLWRDADLEKFVAKHYAGVLTKFRTLKHHIMRVDMMRYMILHHFGGVYADLDYILVRPLDYFLKFPATVPITAEAIAMIYFGMTWPPPRMGNPAFMVSEPGHPFFFFCILQLATNPSQDIFQFAGPLGLSAMVKQYEADFPAVVNPGGVVLVPPSRAFDAFANNSFTSSTTVHKQNWINELSKKCVELRVSMTAAGPLQAYCKDVHNMDPITNRSDVSYAVHDTRKTRTSYDPAGSVHFSANAVDIRRALPTVLMADQFF